MTKKKLIPDVSDILGVANDKMKFSIKKPTEAKEKAMNEIEENAERINTSLYKDFATLTLGDYINAAQVFNREMMGTGMDDSQRAAYFTLFAFEERAKRISDHYTHIH